MKRARTRYAASLAAFSILVSLACAPKPPVAPSGYLGDYSGFVPDPEGGERLIYTKPDLDLARYRRVIIDPVVVELRDEGAGEAVDAAQLVALANYLRDALLIALRGAYPVVEEPGPDVLRLRVGLVDVVPTKPVLNTIGTLAIPARAASAAKRAITGTDLFVGEVAIEAEVLDSQTGERLLGLVDRKAGDKFGLREGSTTWGHVAQAFREWAVGFRLTLDRANAQRS